MKATAYLYQHYLITIIVCMTFACIAGSNLAATVILGPGGLTNFVVQVPTNELMVVRASSYQIGAENQVSVTSGGITYQTDASNVNVGRDLDTSLQTRYLAGPCTFSYTNRNMLASIFDYDIVPTSGVHTLVGTNAMVLQVASGQRLDVLDCSYPLAVTVTLTNGASATFNLNIGSGEANCSPYGFEIAGPLTVTVNPSGSPNYSSSFFITYFFASDVVKVAGPAIQSPAGSIVTVEKSTDLQNWYPAYLATETTAPKAFYRLKVVQ